jgi:hypothetical protein
MQNYTERHVKCPHCGHSIGITLDASNGTKSFMTTALHAATPSTST